MVCLDCKRCNGKPPLQEDQRSPEAVKIAVIARTEKLINQVDSGVPVDFEKLSYLEWLLIEIYREAVSHQERIIKVKQSRLFEAFVKANG